MAKLDPKPFVFPVQKAGEPYHVYLDRNYDILNKMIEKSCALPEGEIKGGIVRFQIADGYAEYIVTKIRPLTLQHIPIGDGYQIPEAHVRGLNKADIVELLRQEKFMHDLFSKK